MVQVHPTSEQLEAFLLGKLGAGEQQELEAHIESCEQCCDYLKSVDNDTFIDRTREAHDSVVDENTPLATPLIGATDIPEELANHARYRIIKQIGAGGMGRVFQAEHRLMERAVALKVINQRYLADQQAIERFHREVRTAARLNHPNIVAAFDAEQAGNLNFLVMEYISGLSLAQLVQLKGPLSVGYAANFIAQAAKGLQHAHDKGMVHRDIKPQNLMVTRTGLVKILDFGLARIGEDHTLVEPVTQQNTVVGTPDYLAPEQAKDSRSVDARADIYALGCTLYFLLTGKPPFPEGSAIEKLFQHVECEPAPISDFRSDVPPEMLGILNKMMAKLPAQRFQRPVEIAEALLPLMSNSSSLALGLKKKLPARSEKSKSVPPPLPESREDRTQLVERGSSSKSDVQTTRIDTKPNTNFEWDSPSTQRKKPAPAKSRKSMPKKKLRRKPWLIAIPLVVLLLTALGIYLATRSGSENNDNQASVGSNKPVFPTKNIQPVLFVLPSSNLWNPDFEPVRDYLKERGIPGVVVSPHGYSDSHWSLYQQGKGRKIFTDKKLSDIKSADGYSAIVFVGENVSEFLPEAEHYDHLKQLTLQFVKKQKIVAALCVGQKIPLSMGLLDGRMVAKNNDVYEYLPNRPVTYKNAPVWQDGNIITGSHPDHAKEFAEKLCLQLND
ncbi:MAG: protein kinase [Zavarzinella sp.]